jgi:DNA-binding MarR family transcriptional regulator
MIGSLPIIMRHGKTPEAAVVADRLHSACIHLLRYARETDKLAPVGPAQLSALSVLVFAGPRTVGELAELEHVRSPTMSGIIAALEAKGLVRREPHASDRRSVLVHSMPAGAEVLGAARNLRIGTIAKRLNELGADQLRLLAEAADMIDQISQGRH